MECRIDALDHKGRGIVRGGDKIIFVENSLPNELVEIEMIKSKKKYGEAKVKMYLQKNNDRVNPRCPNYLKCGGCHIMHLPYDSQLEWKQQKIEEILKKFGNITLKPKNIIGSKEWNYRNKVTLQVKQQTGYYEKNSDTLVPIEHCLIASPIIDKWISFFNSTQVPKGIQQIMIRSTEEPEECMIVLKSKEKISNEWLAKIVPQVTSCIVQYNQKDEIYGNSYIYETIGDTIFSISADSFFQVNSKQAIILYEKVREYADLKKEDCILDLYCGTGTIGLYLSKYCNHVLGVEVVSSAIEDARRNQALNQITNAEWICGDVSKVMNHISDHFDVIIVDPPRSGLDQKTIDYLNHSEGRKIVYVSCDPVTLARDLKSLENYEVKEITPVDMFPNTYHVECVCLLNRR